MHQLQLMHDKKFYHQWKEQKCEANHSRSFLLFNNMSAQKSVLISRESDVKEPPKFLENLNGPTATEETKLLTILQRQLWKTSQQIPRKKNYEMTRNCKNLL